MKRGDATMKGVQVEDFARVERAEKRFVLAIFMAFVTSIYNLATKFGNMDLQSLRYMPLSEVVGLILTVVTLVLTCVAVWEYISVSLVFERKLEIKPK